MRNIGGVVGQCSVEQPIISKHCHALLSVPPIYRDVMENARGSKKHRRRFPSCRAGI